MKALQFNGFAIAVSGLLLLGGCLDDSGGGSSTGTMNLDVTDAPVDSATRVVVQFGGIEIQPADGEKVTFEYDSARQIDLLALQGTASEPLLDGEQVPAGEYEWIRVMVTGERMSLDSFIEMDDGTQHSLFVPSGAETGLKLVSGFTVPVGGSADFTIDFDLRKSVTEPGQSGNDYILRPALRLVDNTRVGTLTGSVDGTTAAAEGCEPAVYVYEGSGVTPDDEGSETSPLTSAAISLDDATGEYTFTVGFLSEGDYTAAWTCEADMDDPEVDDEIAFEASADATITANETTEVSM